MPKSRLVTSLPVAAVVCVAGFSAPASAQIARPLEQPVAQIASAAQGELQGVVADDRGVPLAGAVVSALGATTAFAVTDSAGRFSFRTLPPGPYLVRAHLSGYVPARGRVIQVNSAARAVSSLTLARRGGANEPAQIVAAGVGGADAVASTSGTSDDSDDHSETAWRLRHLKRSVLKEAAPGAVTADAGDEDDSFWEDSVDTLGRAMGQSARVATSLFADLPLTGQVNFLTTTSFDQPQELFSTTDGPPRGVAFVSLDAPMAGGDWNVRGAMTEGDLSSWVVAGSYVRRSMNAHRYEAGLSYSMQRYEGGNPAALVAVADGSRRAASLYAYDQWALDPRVTLTYGARYARYDYLDDQGLFSPRLAVTVAPIDGERSLRIRAAASRREIAPGAEEFLPSASLGVWLPPERTFSPLSTRLGFRPERVDHIEIAGEQDIGELMIGLRAFRQSVNDQIITLFGVSRADLGIPDVGHYYVASGGDLEARGWGVSVSRTLAGNVRGSIDYTQTEAHWARVSPDVQVLSVVARSALRQDMERVHDLTTSVHAEIPVTDTRVFVLYKLNSAFAASEPSPDHGRFGARFDVQVNQALPFLNFTSAQWEALFTVRNLFREDVLEASIYDELLVVKPPKRVVGGLTVRF